MCVLSCTKFGLIQKADPYRCNEGSQDKVTLALRCILHLKAGGLEEKREGDLRHIDTDKGHTEMLIKIKGGLHPPATDCQTFMTAAEALGDHKGPNSN